MRKYDLTEYKSLVAKQLFFETINRMKKGQEFLFITELGKIIAIKKKKKILFELNGKEIEQTTLNNMLAKTDIKKSNKKYKVEKKGKNSVLLNNRQTDCFYTKDRIEHVFEFRDYHTKKERKKLYKSLPNEFTGETLLAAINKVFNNPPAYDVFLTFTMLDDWGF